MCRERASSKGSCFSCFCSPFLHFCCWCWRRGKECPLYLRACVYWRKMRLPAIKCVAVRLYSLNSDFGHCFYLGGPKLLTSIHLNPSNGSRKAPHKCRFRVSSFPAARNLLWLDAAAAAHPLSPPRPLALRQHTHQTSPEANYSRNFRHVLVALCTQFTYEDLSLGCSFASAQSLNVLN